MFQLSRSATLLWLVVVTAGASLLAWSGALALADLRLTVVALMFVAAGTIAETFHVSLPASRSGHNFNESVAPAMYVAAALVLPVHWATLVSALSIGFGVRTVWFKRVFNSAQIALCVGAASAVWHFSGASKPTQAGALPWLLAAPFTYFAVGTLTPAIVALASGLPIGLTWWRGYKNIWPATFAIMFSGLLLAVLWSVSPWSVALAAIPLTALYYTIRNAITLETQTREALFKLADILDARDPYTHGHSLRVGEYAEKLALAMGLSGEDAHLIYLSGRLHDIGKCAVKNEVLLKPGALDEEERAHMCIHPEVGGSMLNSFSLFKECAAFVRGHHERWDGKGYPDRLVGEAIPMGARVIAVADAYDAMTTTRPYRTALPREEAFRRLRGGAGTQWDARVVEAFLQMMDAEAPTPLPIGGASSTAAAA